MNEPIIFRRIAQTEFNRAVDFYEGRRTGQGAAFTAAVRRVLIGIGLRPFAHPVVHHDIREAFVRDTHTPFIIGRKRIKSGCLPSSTRHENRANGKADLDRIRNGG